jgi:hypothetical protein
VIVECRVISMHIQYLWHNSTFFCLAFIFVQIYERYLREARLSSLQNNQSSSL